MTERLKEWALKNGRKQVWVNDDFAERLDLIKAKARVNGRNYDSVGDLTREMIRLPEFDAVERHLVENERKAMKKLCKFDEEFQ